ncbi:MAG: biopolymer transporter ExbD, partial [Candidatus Competibacterales bacterium]|nr:biopolymer transporter ExbD [Candidatus Competibacterales bacterium]
MRLRVTRSRRRIISLTPLIDVVFILLFFFMLASSFIQWRSIDLGLAGAEAGARPLAGTVLVRIRADGSLDLNAAPVSLAELEARLRTRPD